MGDKLINDGVYRTIVSDSILMQFIDTPQFQRLRFIKQLGFVPYVYPSANHTRFEHSIGTAYLAGELLKHLSETNKDIFEQVSDKDIQCVKLAGLLHDIGHGPFSHSWELAINKAITDPNHHFHHERVSMSMIDYLIDTNPSILEATGLNNDDIAFVKELIDPGREEKSSRRDREELGFLYQIISNEDTGCDVDKWDYLNRDAHHAGLETSFDYRRLMFNARVVWYGGRTQIAFRDKALPSLLQMFETRKAMHYAVYQHRVVKHIERLFVFAIKESANQVHPDPKFSLPLLNAHTEMDVFMGLDDSILQRIYLEGPEKARSFIGKIRDRKFHGHCMLDCDFHCEDLEQFDEDKLESEFMETIRGSKFQGSFCFSVQKPDFGMGDGHPLANLVVSTNEGKSFYLKEDNNYLQRITPSKIQQNPKLSVYAEEKPRDQERAEIQKSACDFLTSKGIEIILD